MSLRSTFRNLLVGAIANSLAFGASSAQSPPNGPDQVQPIPGNAQSGSETGDGRRETGDGGRFRLAVPGPLSPVPQSGSDPSEVAPWPITRYEKMIRKSPFAPATAAPVVAAVPGFATNLYLSGLAKIGDREFVSISSRDQATKFSLFTGETNNLEGIQLVSVQWADAVGKSKVTVKKGTEFGVLEYDQALLQKPVQMTPPNIQPPPGVGIAQPGRRPVVVPRNQTFQPSNQVDKQGAFNPNQPGNGQPAIPTRRRSIIRNER